MNDSQPFVLALDVGTSSFKAVVYAQNGRVLASESQRYEYAAPQLHWAEADPRDWSQAMDVSLSSLAQQSGLLENVKVVAFTGQMHTAILLDESCQPLKPTILWLDRRAAAETAQLQEQWNLPPYQLNSTYTLPKLLWLTRHQPEVVAKIRHILWTKDYLRFLLTGRALTDITEAGGAALLNWQTLTWAGERLESMGIDPGVLPPILRPEEDAGPLLAEAAEKYRLNPNAKVIVGAGDVLALISNAPPAVGRVACSLGSSSMVFCPLEPGENITDPQRRIYTYPLLAYPMLGGVSSTSGAALQWAWQSLYPQTAFEDAVRESARVPMGCDGVFFLPFLSGERSPFWNDNLRGGFYGLTLAHTRAHLLRATMEGVAFSLAYLLNIFGELGVAIKEIALAGGGATTPGWAKIVANVCQLPVCVYSGQETVTRALFAYACLATGGPRTFEEALLQTFDAPVWIYPDAGSKEIYSAVYRRYCALADFAHNHL
jgi:xylulokinase